MRRALRLAGLAVVAVAASLILGNSSAFAYSNSHLMDDMIFDNVGSMNETQIRNFINSRPSSCLAQSGAIFPEPVTYFQYGPANVDAARVIYNAAVYNDLNPQVILATLQKEQSLIDRTSCFEGSGIDARNKAMGQGCPDGGACPAPAYAGFQQQVMKGAWQLKFNKERANGNVSWGDNGSITYGGPWTEGNRKGCETCANIYRDGYWTIDGQPTKLETGATASFYRYTPHLGQALPGIFEKWFGSTTVPSVLKSATGNTVYLYTNNYKIAVPSMAILQDYGFDPNAIGTVSQASLDAIPTPSAGSGISSSLGYILKTPSDTDGDGGTAYLVSVGKKRPISSMAQFNGFGFTTQNIVYLPESFVAQIPSGNNLSDFLKLPDSTVFQITGTKKRILFDLNTFKQVNPAGSVTPVSANIISSFPPGDPVASRDILLRTSNGSIHLLRNNLYYALPSMDVFRCWGFGSGGAQSTAMYQASTDAYIGAFTSTAPLSCLTSDGQGGLSLLNRVNRLSVPGAYGVTGAPAGGTDVVAQAANLPSAGALKRAVKAGAGAAIWFVESGVRKPIPTLNNYNLLGLSPAQTDTLDDSALTALPTGGLKLAPGQVVKAAGDASVYIVADNSRVIFNTADDFLAFHYGWNEIETYPAAELDAGYPVAGNNTFVNRYIWDDASSTPYLVDAYGCYNLSGALLAAYGHTSSELSSGQPYNSAIFKKFLPAACGQGSKYAAAHGQGAVYYINGGTKAPFASWNALLNHNGGAKPNILDLNPTTLQALPTGQAIQ